jgi:hypothetical protein
VWASTESGNKELETIYQKSSSVYLFFTVFDSKHFCGVAKMLEPPRNPRMNFLWSDGVYGHTFSIEWICIDKEVAIPFWLNTRDGTELGTKLGQQFLDKFQ